VRSNSRPLLDRGAGGRSPGFLPLGRLSWWRATPARTQQCCRTTEAAARGGGVHPQRVRRAACSLLDETGDGLLSGRLLQHGAGRRWQPPSPLPSFSNFQNRVATISRRHCRTTALPAQTRRSLVFMCAPLAGSTRSRPSAPRGAARHSRGYCSLVDLKRYAVDLASLSTCCV
jgi:hypothetical protein